MSEVDIAVLKPLNSSNNGIRVNSLIYRYFLSIERLNWAKINDRN